MRWSEAVRVALCGRPWWMALAVDRLLRAQRRAGVLPRSLHELRAVAEVGRDRWLELRPLVDQLFPALPGGGRAEQVLRRNWESERARRHRSRIVGQLELPLGETMQRKQRRRDEATAPLFASKAQQIKHLAPVRPAQPAPAAPVSAPKVNDTADLPAVRADDRLADTKYQQGYSQGECPDRAYSNESSISEENTLRDIPYRRKSKKSARRQTWLTPIGSIWRERYSAPEAVVPYGAMARWLRPLVAALAADDPGEAGGAEERAVAEVGRRLRIYLAATQPDYVNLARFAQTWGAWSEPPKPRGSAFEHAEREALLYAKLTGTRTLGEMLAEGVEEDADDDGPTLQ